MIPGFERKLMTCNPVFIPDTLAKLVRKLPASQRSQTGVDFGAVIVAAHAVQQISPEPMAVASRNAATAASLYFTGRNFGSVYSGKSSKTTSTDMPILTSSGAQSMTLVTRRPPSCRSTNDTL